jgi:ABC-type multidrug transport system fused ATPase/permease subunit
LLALVLTATTALQLLYPQVLRYFIDTALAGGAQELLVWAAIVFLVTALSQQALGVLATAVGERVAWSATNALREDLTLHCLTLDQSFHKTHTPGELIERVDGDISLLANFLSQFAILVGGNALLLTGVLVLLYREDVRIGLAFTAFTAIGLAIQMALRGPAVVRFGRERAFTADAFGRLGEWLTGTEDIRSSGAVGYVQGVFASLIPEWLRIRVSAGVWGSTTGATQIALFAIGQAIALGLGGWLLWQGQITIGTVYLLFQYMEQVRQPIERIRTLLDDFQRAGASILRVRALLETPSNLADSGTAPLPNIPLSVELREVSFAYHDAAPDERALENITFQLAPGRTLGLLGRTGSGKTTISRLLVRLYDPQAGEVCVGGLPLQSVRLDSLRHHVRTVTQDVQLFRASLRDNLSFFDPTIPDDTVWRALAEVGLDRWADALDGKLDVELDPGGLSAGEAQLLACARVFIADPGVVILDEASSRLDPATERQLRQSVDRLLAGRTGIVIAHRLATIRRVDDILILEAGRVVELGAREELEAAADSRFARLLRTGEMAELLV